MTIKLLTTISLVAMLAACGGGGSGGGDTGVDTGGGDTGGGDTGGGDTGGGDTGGGDTGGGDTSSSFDDVGGVSGSGGSVTVEDVALVSSISGNGGTTHIYNSTDIGGTSVTPTGVIAGSSEIVFAFDPFGDQDEMLLGIDSSQEHTTDINSVSASFSGTYAETLSGDSSSFSTGAATMTVDGSAGTMDLECGNCMADGAELVWGTVDLDGTEVEGFSQTIDNEDGTGYIGAVVFGGDEVVGAYGGVNEDIGVSGTFGGVAD